MAIRVKCPHCQKTLRAPDDWAGRVVQCPGCATPVEIVAPTQGFAWDLLDRVVPVLPDPELKEIPTDDPQLEALRRIEKQLDQIGKNTAMARERLGCLLWMFFVVILLSFLGFMTAGPRR